MEKISVSRKWVWDRISKAKFPGTVPEQQTSMLSRYQDIGMPLMGKPLSEIKESPQAIKRFYAAKGVEKRMADTVKEHGWQGKIDPERVQKYVDTAASSFGKAGKKAALQKLGIALSFDTPQAMRKHQQRRSAIGQVAGLGGAVAGGLAGGSLGGTLGTAAGPVGTAAGGVAGSLGGAELGSRAGAAIPTLMYDVAHDVPQRARESYRGTVSRLSAAAGLPSGMTNDAQGGL